jgi:hypothetical protein
LQSGLRFFYAFTAVINQKARKNNRSFAKVRRPAAVTCHEASKNISKIFLLNPKVLQKAAVIEMRSVKALLFCRWNWFSS